MWYVAGTLVRIALDLFVCFGMVATNASRWSHLLTSRCVFRPLQLRINMNLVQSSFLAPTSNNYQIEPYVMWCVARTQAMLALEFNSGFVNPCAAQWSHFLTSVDVVKLSQLRIKMNPTQQSFLASIFITCSWDQIWSLEQSGIWLGHR